jgi:hypothetical protein
MRNPRSIRIMSQSRAFEEAVVRRAVLISELVARRKLMDESRAMRRNHLQAVLAKLIALTATLLVISMAAAAALADESSRHCRFHEEDDAVRWFPDPVQAGAGRSASWSDAGLGDGRSVCTRQPLPTDSGQRLVTDAGKTTGASLDRGRTSVTREDIAHLAR